MRVGLITQLLFSRYGGLWEKLLVGVGVEVCRAEPEAVERALQDERLARVPGVAFRLAAAEALALADADALLAPELNPDTNVLRGGGQDPFISSFPDALGTSLGGLPPTIGVPASLGGDLEPLVVRTLHSLTRDPALVRRVWERYRASAKAPKVAEPRWRVQPSEGATVGVIGQPWLLRERVLPAVLGETQPHLISQHQLEPALLRDEGQRADARLIPTDREVLGAARYLGRKGSIGSLVMIADSSSGADAWLASRAQKLTRKPLEVRYLQDTLMPDALLAAFLS